MEKVDATIEAICDWIQVGLKEPGGLQEKEMIPEMIETLAELVSARKPCSALEPDLLGKIEENLKKQIAKELQAVIAEIHY